MNGEKAPDFTLMNQDDKEITLSGYAGKWVILYFYPKDNTSGCTKEACGFTEALPDFSGMDAVILGVSRDSTKVHRGFIEKQNLKITLLSDPDHSIHEAYNAWGEKKMYGKVTEGVLRSTFIIDPDGIIAASWKNVKVNGHVDKVKEKLAALQAK